MNKSDFNVGDILVCKKGYEYNGIFLINDLFIVDSLNNDFNIRLKTPIDTYHIIPYKYEKYSDHNMDDLFHNKLESRKMKIEKLKQNINI